MKYRKTLRKYRESSGNYRKIQRKTVNKGNTVYFRKIQEFKELHALN